MGSIKSGKPRIAMDISTIGKGGGPFTSTKRIMSSSLTETFSFHEIIYDPKLGRGISIKRIFDLRRQLLNIQPDIVHFTGLQLSGFHIAVACFLAGVQRTVVTIRGSSADVIEFPKIKRFLLTTFLEPLTLAISKKIIGVSDYVTNSKVPKIFSKKVFGTIYNFPPLIKTNNYGSDLTRESLGLSEKDTVVITVSRINREKGLHILESAIVKIGVKKNLKFLIVGDGEYLPDMKSNLSKFVMTGQVQFLGHRDDIFELNKISDIFVLPTLHETLSNALLEASIASLPLIASDTGGVPEIVTSGFNGILVEPGNVAELSDAIVFLSKEHEVRSLYSNNSYEQINKKFSNDLIIAKLRAVYCELLKT
jgi:glycosyltransferase involved in cell wall biosynthesis